MTNDNFSLLQDNVEFRNASVIAFGYAWLRDNIFLPAQDAEKNCRDPLCLPVLSEAYSILGDASFLVDDLESALFWYKKMKAVAAFGVEECYGDLLHDIAYVCELLGQLRKSRRYYRLYNKLENSNVRCHRKKRKRSEKRMPLWARKQIPINLLTHFNPHIAAKQIAKKHGKQTDLARIILQSVSGNDEEFCNLFYHGIQTGTLKLNHTSFFFVPRAVLDTSLFWRHINECAAYFHTPISFDADLDYVCGESARNSEYAPDEEKRRRKNCIKLQIARTENDLAGMSELANSDKTWQTPSFCLQFYTQHQRMPKWEDVVLWNEDERNTPWANLKNDEAD